MLYKFQMVNSGSLLIIKFTNVNYDVATLGGHKQVLDTSTSLDLFTCVKNWINFSGNHRYRPEVPEPVPSLSQHGAQIGGIQVFSVIKITVIRQVHMYCGLSVKINKHEMLHGTRRSWTHFVCICFCVCGWQKLGIPSIGAPWLMTRLHGEIYEFWDLFSISVVAVHKGTLGHHLINNGLDGRLPV